ncbi:zeta-sarcoglycan-like [Oscarella lobularis]|uniref:zeta-sarcoglycan-like n=1 Tax=Oscarella lobularis TaxID=121494 RepID=UPI003313A209
MASNGNDNGSDFLPVGIYGWRKRCLYFFILLLLVIIVVNLALTVWILVVTNFNVDGMGDLRITDEGIAMDEDSKAKFLGDVYVASIKSTESKPLFLESASQVAMKTGDSVLSLTGEELTATAESFKVAKPDRSTLMTIDDEGTTIQTDLISVGEITSSEISTPLIRSLAGSDLHVEASGGDLFLQAPKVSVSAIDNVNVQASNSISFSAETVTFDSAVHFSNVPAYDEGNVTSPNMREVCICASNSMLFLSPIGNGTSGCSRASVICP